MIARLTVLKPPSAEFSLRTGQVARQINHVRNSFSALAHPHTQARAVPPLDLPL